MADDIEMLSTISKTADMGRESLRQVLEKAEDSGLRHALSTQIKEYEKNYDAASRLLSSYGQPPMHTNPMAKMESQMMVSVKTKLTDNTTSKIAEMVMQGSTMGVTKMTKKLHEYHGNNHEISALAEQQIKTEQANIDEMKKFL